MSSPVSPRQRDIGEVASLRAEGVDRQPQRIKKYHLSTRNADRWAFQLQPRLNSQPNALI